MAQHILRLEKWNPDELTWTEWYQKFENYIEMTGVPDDKKVNLLLDSLGPKPFKRLVAVCLPGKPKDFPLDQLLEKLRIRYTSFTFRKVQIAKFFKVTQTSSETLEDFSEKLQDATAYCQFPSTVLDDNLCAAFINGLQNESTRSHLMTHDLQSFEETLERAKKYEAGRNEAKQSGSRGDADIDVHKSFNSARTN
ncbi:uncharacterized protein LOC129590642 [Paramacrobiotus metropolitanus]|uniref:uncharacterized protein LOC129590642 n=1 Tax=Paramacrobiotus metropolitanus TaxID=2943436 RepID=UPI002446400D|nr:uncharacterized protein LOC129590642 [Paramacrobiotus metropolitanus]